MIMKSLIKLAGVALCATLLLAACSSDGDSPSEPKKPEEKTDTVPAMGNDQRPDWQVVTFEKGQYENIPMTVQIRLQEVLLNYISENDLMNARLNGTVRAVTPPLSTGGEYYFPLSIIGSTSEGSVTLQYYCDKLHRIFTVSDWQAFDNTIPPTVEGVPYEVKFFTGN